MQLLDIRKRLASIPIAGLWQVRLLTGSFGVGVDTLTFVQLQEILEEEDNAKFLEGFKPAPMQDPHVPLEAVLEEEDEDDRELAELYDGGGGGLRRTTSYDDLKALSGAAAAMVPTTSPPKFLFELKRKNSK